MTDMEMFDEWWDKFKDKKSRAGEFLAAEAAWRAAIDRPAAQAVPLTDKQIDDIGWEFPGLDEVAMTRELREFARAIERAHGIK